MYQQKYRGSTTLKVYEAIEDETLETKIARMIEGSDMVTDTKELIFTPEGEGVQGWADIRHDHWDEARSTSSMGAEREGLLDERRLKDRKAKMKEEEERNKFIKDQHEESFKESKKAKKPSNGDQANTAD